MGCLSFIHTDTGPFLHRRAGGEVGMAAGREGWGSKMHIVNPVSYGFKKGDLKFADDGVDADVQRREVWGSGRQCGYCIHYGMAHISRVSKNKTGCC